MIGRWRTKRKSCISKNLKDERNSLGKKERKKNVPEGRGGTHKGLEVRGSIWLICNSSVGLEPGERGGLERLAEIK